MRQKRKERVFLLKNITDRRFEITLGEFRLIGVEVDKQLKNLEKYEYGIFNIGELDSKTIIVLKIIEGMYDWQEKHNKGIEVHVHGSCKSLEIIDLEARQKRMDEAMENFSI